mmetsp:Transcript_24071/g.69646  ORF Transcript_24071/g.69646 Transcript_24071/m.69646 type:complete len:267 (-) Transcript_24071:79-879(-)
MDRFQHRAWGGKGHRPGRPVAAVQASPATALGSEGGAIQHVHESIRRHSSEGPLGELQWRIAQAIPLATVGPRIEEQPHQIDGAPGRREVEWSRANRHGVLPHERTGRVPADAHDSGRNGRHGLGHTGAGDRGPVHRTTGLEQQADGGKARGAARASTMEGTPLPVQGVLAMHVGAEGQQRRQDEINLIVGLQRPSERCAAHNWKWGVHVGNPSIPALKLFRRTVHNCAHVEGAARGPGDAEFWVGAGLQEVLRGVEAPSPLRRRE